MPPTRLARPLSLLLLLVIAGGCGDSALIGDGPIRRAVVDADGTVWVHRSFTRRNADVSVLLTVDPETGAAAPILPRLPGDGSNTVTAVDVLLDRPGTQDELLLVGEDFGVGIMRGPFRFRGAFPTLEVLVDGPIRRPAGGPADAVSPDGAHVVLFRPGPLQSGRRLWQTIVVDVAAATAHEPAPPIPGREVEWLGPGVARIGPAGSDRRTLLLGAAMPADGTATAARIVGPDEVPAGIDLEPAPPEDGGRFVDRLGGVWTWTRDPPQLAYRSPDTSADAPATHVHDPASASTSAGTAANLIAGLVGLAEPDRVAPPAGAAAPAADTMTLIGWTREGLVRLTLAPDATPAIRVTPLPLRFDRER